MAVEFGVLGSIEARVDGRLVELGHARQRLLLAALLVDVNREVSTGQLAERIWGQEHAQRGTLYDYLSRLRTALAAAEGVEIARRPAGYVLSADPAVVDVCRFRELAAQARASEDDQQAADLFGQALSLWRGEALAGADTPWACMVREALRQERLVVELDHDEVRLRLGQHAELAGDLRARTGEFPLNERLAGQLMLALYRCGRTAEALGHYQYIRQILARESGVTPGSELQKLHQQILTGDPALPLEAGAGTGAARSMVEVPRQLPTPPALFIGRSRELNRLSAVLAGEGGQEEVGGTVVISAIGGIGGIGKTSLTVHWAHHHLERFPDGQLYVNLRGFDPVRELMEPSQAVCGFLEALGVAPAAIPKCLETQTALYRGLVAGKRMLIVLDNARDTTQVLPLIPGSPSCTVVVTGRHQLTDLISTHAAQPLSLDVLPEDEARLLLVGHLGEDRLAAEPQATVGLLGHCAGLPLALSITGARAATRPDFPLTYLAEELAATETRLDALGSGELTANLRAVFASSQHALPCEAARAFALLGLTPGPDLSLQAVASLLATSLPRTRALLHTLEDAHLLQQHTPNRYRMHELVHLYAAEHAQRDLDEQHRTTALRRLVDFYLHTAYHAGLLIEPQHMFPVELATPATGCVPHRPVDRKAAWAWYDANRPCLIAIQRLAHGRGWHTPAWQLPHTLFNFHRARGDSHEVMALGRVGLAAAEQLADPRPIAAAHALLGFAYAQALHTSEAFDHLEQALPVFEQSEDLPGQALTHYGFLAAVNWQSGGEGRDLRRGLFHAQRARQCYHALGNTAGECYALSTAGMFHALLGEDQQARTCCERALPLAPADVPHAGAYALLQLGFAAHCSGRYTEALTYHHQALTRWRDYHGETFWKAVAAENLGFTYRALGQLVEARQAWHHALTLYRARHRIPQAERLQQKLDTLGDTLG